MRKYSLEQVSIILLTQNWHSCLCENEKDGEHCPGFDTIQVAVDGESEYFGEFIRDVNENTYTFKFYV